MQAKTVTEHEYVNFPDLDFSSYDEKLKDGLCLNPMAKPFDRRYFLQWNPLSVIGNEKYIIFGKMEYIRISNNDASFSVTMVHRFR